MYIFDTRDKDNINSFPIYGWIFPCYNCMSITTKNKVLIINDSEVLIPVCNRCKHIKKEINSNKIYFQIFYQI